MPKILLVTGETSGDHHGAKLACALKELNPSVELVGVGGKQMKDVGVFLLPQVERVDAIGVPGFRQLVSGWKTLRTLSCYIKQEALDAVVFIDSPGLNLRLAKVAARASHTVIYYIAPQVWAWGHRRRHLIRKVVKRVLAILPFEESYFRNAGIACDYVGHPLLDEIQPHYEPRREREKLGLNLDGMVIGVFPGSREREVRAILPTLIEAVWRLRHRYGEVQVVLAQAESLPNSLFKEMIPEVSQVKIIRGQPNEVMAASSLVLMASGTATLQAALIGVPMVIVYRTSSLTYQIAKRLVTIPFIGLVNILSGKEVVPEFIQQQMTASNVSDAAMAILDDTNRQLDMKNEFHALRKSLGGPGASKRAAQLILSEIQA